MLENWNTDYIYDKYLLSGNCQNSSGSSPAQIQKSAPNTPITSSFDRENMTGRSKTFDPVKDVITHPLPENGILSQKPVMADPVESGKTAELVDITYQNVSTELCKSNDTTEQENKDSELEHVKVEDSDKENVNTENPTERPFTQLLSLDERIDLLIAGERQREHDEDGDIRNSSAESRTSYQGPPSLYTSTFTSITSDASESSDWYTRYAAGSLDSTSTDDVTQIDMTYDVTTSDSASYWWDVGDKQFESRDFKVSVPYNKDVRRRIHLNLENDSSSIDELRNQRLANHIRSVQQTR